MTISLERHRAARARRPWSAHDVTWTRETVIAAIHRWVTEHGDAPTSTDWHPTKAEQQGQAEKVERFYAGDYPSYMTVSRRFGSFAKGIRAAGYMPRAHRGLGYDDTRPPDPRLLKDIPRTQVVGYPGLLACVKSVVEAHRQGEREPEQRHLEELASLAATLADQIGRSRKERDDG